MQSIKAGEVEINISGVSQERIVMDNNVHRDILRIKIPGGDVISHEDLNTILSNTITLTDVGGIETRYVGYTSVHSHELVLLKTTEADVVVDELQRVLASQEAAVAALTAEKESIVSEKEAIQTRAVALESSVGEMRGAATSFLRGKNDDTLVELLSLTSEWELHDQDTGEAVRYELGDVRKHNGHPYICIQAHSTDGDSGRAPDMAAALWSPYHAKSARLALPWLKPTHSGDIYRAGEFMVFTDGKIYENLSDTDWGPDTLPDNWREVDSAGNPVGEQGGPEGPVEPEDPTPEEPAPEEPAPEPDPEPTKNSNGTLLWSEYVPHDGTHETLYGKDDGVTYFGERYLSLHDNNGNLPSSAGWWVRIS